MPCWALRPGLFFAISSGVSLTVLGITIGIAAVICVVAIGKAGQARG